MINLTKIDHFRSENLVPPRVVFDFEPTQKSKTKNYTRFGLGAGPKQESIAFLRWGPATSLKDVTVGLKADNSSSQTAPLRVIFGQPGYQKETYLDPFWRNRTPKMTPILVP